MNNIAATCNTVINTIFHCTSTASIAIRNSVVHATLRDVLLHLGRCILHDLFDGVFHVIHGLVVLRQRLALNVTERRT